MSPSGASRHQWKQLSETVMHYIHVFTSYIQIYFTNTIFCVASIQTHIIWILHIDFPYANSSPRHYYFFWKPLGWKDLNNNGKPNWIKGGMHLHRKWTFIPPSIISSSYRYTLPSNKRHAILKEKSQVLQSCTKKKRLYDGSRLNCFLVCSFVQFYHVAFTLCMGHLPT